MRKRKPFISVIVLGAIVLGCLFCELFMPKDPTYMDLYHTNIAPCKEFIFGTDTMGRDIFSMIWYGGRISLFIGVFSTVVSAVIGILFGAVSGFSPKWIDNLLMRFTEIFLSVPSLLLIIFIQAIFGDANILSISAVIGITGWTGIAKVVRTDVRQLRESGYVIAAKGMGAGFLRILCKHLMPNLISSIMFMIVINVRSAIIAESTLSFIGMGLPVDIVSLGSMLSLSERSLLSGSWWVILIPGAFLVITLLCITNIGNHMRRRVNDSENNL